MIKTREDRMDELSTDKGELIEYQDESGVALLSVAYEGDSLWLTQQQIATLFGIAKQTVGRHISNVYKDKELETGQGVSLKLTPVGNGQVHRVAHYNLDVIISVGYRARKSKTAVHFRQWATQVLKDRLTGATTTAVRLAAELQEDTMRLLAHSQIDDGTERLIDVATSKHRVTNKSSFLEAGDQGIYNMSRDEVEDAKGIPQGQLYEHAGSTELGMHVFRITQTAAALTKDARGGYRHDQEEAEAIHKDIAGRIRAMSHLNSGVYPEELPASRDNIEVVKRRAIERKGQVNHGCDDLADGTQVPLLMPET